MHCNKCGAQVDSKNKYCGTCGFDLNNLQNQQISKEKHINLNSKNRKKMIFTGFCIGVAVLILILIVVIIIGKNRFGYFFSNNGYVNEPELKNDVVTNQTDKSKKNNGKTVIIVDNVYNGVSISDITDANNLISEDSTSQKKKCPKEILKIENEFINKYNITAVNLCEMDVDFAKELENVFEIIYNEYPLARGHITNLSLRNTSMISENGVIAAFMPVFNFATSDSSTSYPWVIKTQILLSSNFFLNKKRLQTSVSASSNAGHFPPNSTIYSPVAHELGHYLSFLAILNNYQMNSILLIDGDNINPFYDVLNAFRSGSFSLTMLNEAYNNYVNDFNSELSFDEWRATISQYALAKDNDGEYIYDETIAESFHDVYLNKENAADASKYIVNVLKKYLGNR